MINEIYKELTVSQFLEVLNLNLRQHNVTVAGEITGRVNRRGGVTYFTIHDQDEDASMTCMGFNSILDKLGITLEEGMAVKVSGYPEVWKRSGMLSFKVFGVLLAGEGSLKLQFEALKKKLDAEGLFEAEYKKPLPSFVKRIGLITAEDREAQNDFLKHLAPRGVSIDLYDVRVEGARAVEQICGAIEWFNKNSPDTEVLVVTRGGGSLESLQAFNSEDIARAIFASRIPVVCGIGHERDVSIADLVADVRASTPTDAAKIISEDWINASTAVDGYEQHFISSTSHVVSEFKFKLDAYEESWSKEIQSKIDMFGQKLDDLSRFFVQVNPELKLRQGYSIIRNQGGKILSSIADLKIDDMIDVQFNYGNAKAKIKKLT